MINVYFKGQDGSLTTGPNAVISMLDHALTENGFGEQKFFSAC